MSAWSDAGWPSGIFFLNPLAAINKIIDAANEIRTFKKGALISKISNFAKRSDLRAKIYDIDFELSSTMSGLALNADTVFNGPPAFAPVFPSWITSQIGDFPVSPDAYTINSGNWLLRWVISRYKMMCLCNKFKISDSLAAEQMGQINSTWRDYLTEAARTTAVNSYLATASGADNLVRIGCRMRKSTYYDFAGACKGRFRYRPFGGIGWVGNGRIGAVVKTQANPLITNYDASLFGDLGTYLYQTGSIVALNATSDTILFDTHYNTWPYSVSPGAATVDTGASLSGVIVCDIADTRQYYDPPEVWQDVNV